MIPKYLQVGIQITKANSTNTGEIAQMPKIKDILCKNI